MQRINLENAKVSLELSKSILDEKGRPILKKGVFLTDEYIKKLLEKGIRTIWVKGDKAHEDIFVPENIEEETRFFATEKLVTNFNIADNAVKAIKRITADKIKKVLKSSKFKNQFAINQVYTQTFEAINSIMKEVLSNEVLTGLNSIKSYDNYTFNHSIDVAITSIMLAKKLELPKGKIRDLGIGALLHDLGKIFIPEEILNKQGKLSKEEFNLIKEHPNLGFLLLRDRIHILPPYVALEHHEKQDGTGYPNGRTGSNELQAEFIKGNIMQMGEIVAVADVYDAITSDRTYQKAYSSEHALKIIKKLSGNHLNKKIVSAFLSIVPVFPVGTDIVITKGKYTGFYGVVKKLVKKSINRPHIRVYANEKGEPIKFFEINLSEDWNTEIQSAEDQHGKC